MSKNSKFLLMIKGFAMGVADIVPGVSGGTIALITGVYENLINSLSSVNKAFFVDLLNLRFRSSFERINIKFLIPLAIGIFTAIITMSKLVHFFMNEYSIYTWSLFFGLICSSILFLAKQIDSLKNSKNIAFGFIGTIVGYIIVSLVPVETSNGPLFLFFSGAIAICAMILPGISGSFILLILGKYLYITSAIKDPFAEGSMAIITLFGAGCICGLLSFSKVLKFLLSKYFNQTMALLTGFMLGSLKKIWPWREVLEQKIIRGKAYVLREQNILPDSFDVEVLFAIIIMSLGFSLIFLLEKKGKRK